MRQLRQRVGLVHELGQRGGAEELLDGRGDGADVDKALGSDDIQILKRHALADNALHTAEADTELVLQQLAHASDAAVAQMVDIIGLAYAVGKAVEVVDGGKNIVGDDVLGDEDVDVLAHGVLESLALVLLAQALHDDTADVFLNAQLLQLFLGEGGVAADVDHAVGEHAHLLAVGDEVDVNDAGVGNGPRVVAAEYFSGLEEYLAGKGVDDGPCQLEARDTGEEGELLIELVAADVGYLVTAAVVEEAVEQGLGGFHGRGIARTELAVYLDKALVAAGGGVLVKGGDHALVLAVDLFEALVGDDAHGGVAHAAEPGGGTVLVVLPHGLEEPCDGELAVLVDTDVENVVRVGLVLEPRAMIRNDGGGVDVDHGLVRGLVEIHAWGTDDLGDDDALGAVDDERAARSHQGEVAHEYLLLLDLLGLLVAQAHLDLERGRVCCVAGLALLLGVLRLLVHGVVDKAQLQIARIVGHGVNVLEDLAKAGLEEPLVRAFLDLQQVGHFHDLLGTGKALSQGLAVENILWHLRTLLILQL